MKREPKKNPLKTAIKNHVINNAKEYSIVIILFLIGVIVGVIVINNMAPDKIEEIHTYLSDFVNSLKGESSIDQGVLLKTSLKNNIGLGIALWFIGSTVIGIPIVYGIIAFRGFCLGYTISSIMATLGSGSGILFTLTTIFLQNILFIPCVLALAVSGTKLYQSILKDKRRENIRLEIIRHTLFSLMLLGILVLSSFIEVYVSMNLFLLFVKYI